MTKIYLKYFFLALALYLIQAAANAVFTRQEFLIPHLVLLFVLVFAVSHSTPEIIWMSFAAGFLLELSSGKFFGAQMFSLLAIAILAYFVTRKLTDRELTWPTVGILVLGATLVLPGLLFVYGRVFAVFGLGAASGFASFYSWSLVWTILVNFIFFFPINLGRRFIEK